MKKSSVYNNFEGYNAYPIDKGEKIIRAKLLEMFDKIIKKNETCMIKARDAGMEKILSRILVVKKRMERMKNEINCAGYEGVYAIDRFKDKDVETLKKIDLSLEKNINLAFELIDSLTCMETDTHIYQRFASMDDFLREIEILCHKRLNFYKKMHVYG